jgi:hypothetical protein
MPSTALPTHRRNPLDALVAHSSQSRKGALSSSHFGRPILRWIGLSTILVAGLWFLSPFFVDTGSLEQTWGKVKQQVPWVNNQPLPAPPPTPTPKPGEIISPDGDPTLPLGDPEKEKEKWAKRRQKVKNAFARAYVGYRNHAYPKDELLPKSGGGTDKCVFPCSSVSNRWLMGDWGYIGSTDGRLQPLKPCQRCG